MVTLEVEPHLHDAVCVLRMILREIGKDRTRRPFKPFPVSRGEHERFGFLQNVARLDVHSARNVLHRKTLFMGQLAKTKDNLIVAQAMHVSLGLSRLQALANTVPVDIHVRVQFGNLKLQVGRDPRTPSEVRQELGAGTKVIHNVAHKPSYPERPFVTP